MYHKKSKVSNFYLNVKFLYILPYDILITMATKVLLKTIKKLANYFVIHINSCKVYIFYLNSCLYLYNNYRNVTEDDYGEYYIKVALDNSFEEPLRCDVTIVPYVASKLLTWILLAALAFTFVIFVIFTVIFTRIGLYLKVYWKRYFSNSYSSENICNFFIMSYILNSCLHFLIFNIK